MKCPYCGNTDVQSHPVSYTNVVSEETKGFGFFKALCGYIIMGPYGLLCGLCGMGKGKTSTNTTTKIEYTCQNCKRRF